LIAKLDRISKEINSAPAFTSANDQSKISDEIKKQGGADKIKKMSKEEKIKMAMDMMKNMSTPQIQLESDEVKDTFAKENELNQFASGQLQEQMSNYKAKTDHDKEVTDKHTGITDWEKTEIAKLPRISSVEMGEPDLKEVKKVNLEAADKHIKIADDELKYISWKWLKLRRNMNYVLSPSANHLLKANTEMLYRINQGLIYSAPGRIL
jgi:hypothetical protein